MILRVLIIMFLFFSSLFGVDARLDIVKSKVLLSNIAINIDSDIKDAKILKKITWLIKTDLKVSGYFKVLDLQIPKKNTNKKIFAQNNVDFVLSIKASKDKNIIFDVDFIDIKANSSVFKSVYKSKDVDKYPFLIHDIVIDIAKNLNRESLQWMKTKVIFSKYTTSGKSKIIISDYTLSYQKVVVDDGLALFPKWANKKQNAFYYTSYNSKQPTLFFKNIKTNLYKKVLSSSGMIICSDVSKDGTKLLITMAPNDQADIYLYNLRTKLKTRLTNYEGIDVGGNFVDNEKRIVFISDRLDYPNIFAKKINSNEIEQVVYHGKNNAQVSSYGNYIVYSSRESFNEFGANIFNLYLISTKSDFIRRLTTTGVNQTPKFSSDGKHILFIKYYRGISYLGLIGINSNKLFLFRLKIGKIQSMDW